MSAQQRTSSDHPGAFFTLEWEAKLASESSKPVALWSTGELRFAPKGRARTWGTGHFAPLSQRTDFLSRQHTKVFPICDLHKSPELSLEYRVQKTIHNPRGSLARPLRNRMRTNLSKHVGNYSVRAECRSGVP